jgi:hypothetical protein
MDNVHLFLSRSAQANIAKSEALHDAVLQLAEVIGEISSSDAERKEFARDARWLLREMTRDEAAAFDGGAQ